MGLDISHNTWHGAYSAFMRWREKIAEVAGFPPLELMEGYYSEEGYSNPFSLLDYKYPKGDELGMSSLRRIRQKLPIKWDLYGNNPLVDLLTHSDCDGEISSSQAGKIACELEKLLPKLEGQDGGGHIGDYVEKTKQFIKGCKEANAARQKLVFG